MFRSKNLLIIQGYFPCMHLLKNFNFVPHKGLSNVNSSGKKYFVSTRCRNRGSISYNNAFVKVRGCLNHKKQYKTRLTPPRCGLEFCLRSRVHSKNPLLGPQARGFALNAPLDCLIVLHFGHVADTLALVFERITVCIG